MEKLFLMNTNTNSLQELRLGFLRHQTPKMTVKKDCRLTILPYCHFVQVQSIPDRLLPSSACFRFDLTRQRYIDLLKNRTFAQYCKAISGQTKKCQVISGQLFNNL
jgi:hypothetical protein